MATVTEILPDLNPGPIKAKAHMKYMKSIDHVAAKLGLTPSGLTENIVRAALLSQPLHGVNFFANYLGAEKKSFNKLQGLYSALLFHNIWNT